MKGELLKNICTNKVGRARAQRILKELFTKHKKVEFFDRGRHAVILLLDKILVCKVEKDTPAAKGCAASESEWLLSVNKFGIGPKFVYHDKILRFLVYEFVPGKYIDDILLKLSDKELKRVVSKSLAQARQLDKIGINKEEMHRPVKHIIVEDGSVTMIDFERCHASKNPKNVSQLANYFFVTKKVGARVGVSDVEAIGLVKRYKRTSKKEKVFKKILELFSA